jgi:hypothetical protein
MMQKRMLSNARLSWRSSLSAVRTRLHRRGSAAARRGDGAQEEKRPHASDMWKSSASGILLATRGRKIRLYLGKIQLYLHRESASRVTGESARPPRKRIHFGLSTGPLLLALRTNDACRAAKPHNAAGFGVRRPPARAGLGGWLGRGRATRLSFTPLRELGLRL